MTVITEIVPLPGAGLVGVAVNAGVGDGGVGVRVGIAVGTRVGAGVTVATGIDVVVGAAAVGVMDVTRGLAVVAGRVPEVAVGALTVRVGDGVTTGVGKNTNRALHPETPNSSVANRTSAEIVKRAFVNAGGSWRDLRQPA